MVRWDKGISFSQGLKEMGQVWGRSGTALLGDQAMGTRGWYLPTLGFQDRVTLCASPCVLPASLSEADKPAFTACSTCSMTYHVLWARAQHVPGPGGQGEAWGRRVAEEGQKNVRLERFKEGARDEQNMRLGPQQERLRMETKAERDSA